ncbi:YhfG family protein [Duganella guangzhouensis]
MKRQAFLRLRNENYVASLKLEGLSAVVEGPLMTLAELKEKYAR